MTLAPLDLCRATPVEDMDALLAALPQRLAEVPLHWAKTQPDAPAMRQDGEIWTYDQLATAIHDTAAWMRDLGVRPGDRVVIVNETTLGAVPMIYAAGLIDAWAVVVNARVSAREVDNIVEHSGARRVFFTVGVSDDAQTHATRHKASTEERPRLGAIAVGPLRDVDAEPVSPDGADQVACMIYTTGTTGTPKGVMLTHRNMLYVAAVVSRARAMSPADIAYLALPIAHVFGLSSALLGTMFAGGCLEMRPVFSTSHLVQSLARDISVFQGVPAMYAALLEHLDATGQDLNPPALRYLSSGGAPLDLSLKRRVERTLGVVLVNGYGMTETAPTMAQTLISAPREDDSIGPPIAGVAARIVDHDGHDVATNDTDGTDIGELWISGPGLMKGYYHNAKATAEVVTPDGWFNTGDLARMDGEGNLFIVGRSKELIIRSGFNVYPPEVEAEINAHPMVTQSAVVGRRVEGNEEVVAYVQPAPDTDMKAADLKAFLKDRLAPYKRPSHIVLMDKLPAAPTGKILKGDLKTHAQNLAD